MGPSFVVPQLAPAQPVIHFTSCVPTPVVPHAVAALSQTASPLRRAASQPVFPKVLDVPQATHIRIATQASNQAPRGRSSSPSPRAISPDPAAVGRGSSLQGQPTVQMTNVAPRPMLVTVPAPTARGQVML